MKPFHPVMPTASVLAVLLVTVLPLQGQTTRTWTGAGVNTLASTAENWSDTTAPVTGDSVVFDTRPVRPTAPGILMPSGAAGTIYTETYFQGVGCGQLLIANDNRDLGAVTNTLTWLPAPGSGFADELRNVTLVISNQAHVALSSDLTVGDLFIRQDTPSFL